MANDKLQKEFDLLYSDYQESDNPEILQRIYEITDKLVYAEKINGDLRHLALERLEGLERGVELSPLLKYRKAVTLFLLKRKEQALVLFRELIQYENTETYIKDRCRGYLLKYFDDVIKAKEAFDYFKDLRKTSDSTALQMLEEIEISGIYELEEDSVDEEQLEDEMIIFTSNDRLERTFKRRISEVLFRSANPPESYDLFLDTVQQKYFLFGKEVSLSPKEVKTLFTMARLGQQCEIQNLYPIIYRENYNFTKQQKDKFQKFTSRFRQNKLATIGFTFNGTILPGNYTYCLLYNSQFENTLFEYKD